MADMEQWQRDAIAQHLETLDRLARCDFAEIRSAHDTGDTREAVRLMLESQRRIAQAGMAAQSLTAGRADSALGEEIHRAIKAAQSHLQGVMASLGNGYRFDAPPVEVGQ